MNESPRSGLAVTDLDGTLLNSERHISIQDQATLLSLQDQGVITVAATGRCLSLAHEVLPNDIGLDWLVFSSGAGIFDLKRKELFRIRNLDADQAQKGVELLLTFGLDFLVYDPIPHDHQCRGVRQNAHNPDYDRRIARGTQQLHSTYHPSDHPQRIAQILAILPPGQPDHLDEIRRQLRDFSVLRTTSPTDFKSTWIEIFHPDVSKSQAVSWITDQYGLSASKVFAIGDDTNDRDLLDWAGSSFVVQNAHTSLRASFPSVSASNNESGFSKAVQLWLKRPQQ